MNTAHKTETDLQNLRRFRSGRLLVAPDDKRSPMVRLLQDGNNTQSGMIEVNYAQQWRTLCKGQSLGYIDDHQRLTEKGRKWLETQHVK